MFDGLARIFAKPVINEVFIDREQRNLIGHHLAQEALRSILCHTVKQARHNVALAANRADDRRLAGVGPISPSTAAFNFAGRVRARFLCGRSSAIASRARFRWTGDGPDLAVRAAVDGLGIAYTIEALAEPFLRSGQLVRVLEDWSPRLEGLFLYYPGHRQVPATLRALIDMIRCARSKPGKSLLKNPFTKI
jgi:DNA-binding transcriptional LysR family regulator